MWQGISVRLLQTPLPLLHHSFLSSLSRSSPPSSSISSSLSIFYIAIPLSSPPLRPLIPLAPYPSPSLFVNSSPTQLHSPPIPLYVLPFPHPTVTPPPIPIRLNTSTPPHAVCSPGGRGSPGKSSHERCLSRHQGRSRSVAATKPRPFIFQFDLPINPPDLPLAFVTSGLVQSPAMQTKDQFRQSGGQWFLSTPGGSLAHGMSP